MNNMDSAVGSKSLGDVSHSGGYSGGKSSQKGPSKPRADDATIDWILLAITLLILFVFWGLLIYLALTSIPTTTVTTGSGAVLVNCPPGQCATNIYNGEKRCPAPTGTIVSDAGIEVCNTADRCDNDTTPYALLSDGSTDPQGLCESGVHCRCMRYPNCPSYVVTLFKATDGNPYGSVPGTRTKFQQYSSSTNPNTGQSTTNTPLTYTDVSTTFCTVPLNWLPRSTPGCTFSESVDLSMIKDCMGGQTGCNGSVYNPCLEGTLAFISNDSDAFVASSIDRTPLGCVAGQHCGCGDIAIYDTKLGSVVCKSNV